MAPRCVRWIAVCFVAALTASQATIAAPAAAPHAPVAHLTWSHAAEKKELLEIRRDAEERVLALVARMKGLPQGAAFEALERDAQGIKRQCEIDFLTTKLAFARGRGDLGAAQELEDAINLLVNPPRRSVSPQDAARAASPDKGGRQ